MNPEISAIIVEDVKAFHSVIESLLSEVAPHVKIVGCATNLSDAEKLIVQLSPSLVFLDIQFEAEGKTAFDMLKNLSEQNRCNFQIIIITAFNQEEYYAEAFNYGALHFLTKPIDKIKLKEAIERVKNSINNPTVETWMSQLSKFHGMLHADRVDKITIEGFQYTELVDVADIVYLEAWGHYTYIYLRTNGSKPSCSSINIGEYERKLADYPRFVRIHRTVIVNVDYIERFSKKDYTIILIAPFGKLRASKVRFKDFVRMMDPLIGKL